MQAAAALIVREPNHHHAQIIRRVVGHGIVEQALGSFLRVGNIAHNVHCGLVFAHVPQLCGVSTSLGSPFLIALPHMQLPSTDSIPLDGTTPKPKVNTHTITSHNQKLIPLI